MDALSNVLRVVGLTGGVFMEAEFTEPWAVAGQVAPELCRPFMAPPRQVVSFHYVAEGAFELRLEDGQCCRLAAGEAVLLPRNDLHVFGSAASLAPVAISELIRPSGSPGMSRVVHGGGGARTRLICGFLGGHDQLELLLSALPPVMRIDVAGLPGGDWIARTFAYAAETSASGDPGADTVLAKVSELLFIETLRRHLAELPDGQTGWLAGLRDPAIGRALSLLHARIDADWTSEALAREVAMSRSAFTERFTALVGQPPIRYLTGWRMNLARQMLAESRRSVAEIGYAVGYDSEAAFARAFRRECGAPPAAWRRQAEHDLEAGAAT